MRLLHYGWVLIGLLGLSCAPVTPERSASEPAVIDLNQVTVGDAVMGLRVTHVEATSSESLGTFGTVGFEGDITLMGTYSNTPLADTTAISPCFYVAAESSDQLPQVQGDNRNPWFCFTNDDDAEAALGDRVGETITIVIDQYTIHYIPSDVVNQARFVQLAEP